MPSPAATGLAKVTFFSTIIITGGVSAQDTNDTKSTQPQPTEDTAKHATAEPTTDSAETADQPTERHDTTLDEIVISATRTSHSAFEVPFSTNTISREQFQDRSYRTIPDSLRDIPGILVQKTSHGQGSPYIRGFTGFRNVYLIDGIRLNNSVFRDGPNQYLNTVDPYSLDRMEVLQGSSSVLYGSDAIGGVVSMFTTEPFAYGGSDSTSFAGRTLFRYASGENAYVGRVTLSTGIDDKIGLVIGGTLKDFGDVEAGKPIDLQRNTGYGEYDADFKLEYFINEQSRLVVAHQIVRQNNVPRTHKTVFSESFHGTTTGSELRRDLDQERELTYVQFFNTNEDSPLLHSTKLSLSWQRQAETRDRVRTGNRRDIQGFEVGTLGITAQMESEDSAIGQFTYGVEYYHDNVNSFSTKNPIQGPVADDASYDLFGLYLQDELTINDRTSLIVGGRFDYASANADSVQDPVSGSRISISEDWSSFVGNARLSYQVVPDHLNYYGGVSQGFRAPNLSDLTRLDSARTNEIETPAPGLDPEHFITYETGFKARGDVWSATSSYFYTDISDMIIRTPTGKVIGTENEITKLNAGNGFVQGIQVSGVYRPHDNWKLFGSMSWTDGEVDTFPTATSGKRREPIDRLMPLTGELGVRYDDPNKKFWVEGLTRMADKADRLSTRDQADSNRIPPGGTPGYAVFSIRSGYRINANAKLTFGIENIFDKNYRVHGSGQNEVGRNFIIGAEFTF